MNKVILIYSKDLNEQKFMHKTRSLTKRVYAIERLIIIFKRKEKD